VTREGKKLTENEVIGTAIRRVRERQGVSGREVERRGGLSKGSLSMIELGKRGPYWGTIRKVAKGIGVPLEVVMEEVEKIEKMEAEG
jgi:transcriptional regulator with XRE-family HTH domain